MTVNLDSPTVVQAMGVYAELTGRQLLPNTNTLRERVDDLLGGKLSQLRLVARTPAPDSGVREHADGPFTAAEVKGAIEAHLRTNGLALRAVGEKGFAVENLGQWVSESMGKASPEQAWLDKHEKPLALIYTYSLIIAIVCGTAGLPHILVRFYTNPDGTAAKKTTMWVMILIGVFYVFPPIFGVMGRNLLPSLYAGSGAKGTDKVVLELPRILNSASPTDSLTQSREQEMSELVSGNPRSRIPWGSILSGITCAGAFAAFMSTFSGLLVSMTGALAHDVYGRILRPKATPEQRMRMFKISAVLIGTVAVVLGSFVEPLQINFMVGQAFAIAAASYFPLLFMSVWWRGMTMKGAAAGMLTGGICALFAVTITNFSDLKWINMADFWAAHPLLRILCEQPAIWTVPLAIGLMVIVSKLTKREVPSDSRMKMLVLHAPEQLGLKQEYIQEHQSPTAH
jgi:Na+(H+)/acetate symporter ActP